MNSGKYKRPVKLEQGAVLAAVASQPAYTQQQASSDNRASKAKGQPGWFADSDGMGFLRTEVNGERTEWVLMEHRGPGCLTRMWTPFFYMGLNNRTGPNLRIYHLLEAPVLADGDPQPTARTVVPGETLVMDLPQGAHAVRDLLFQAAGAAPTQLRSLVVTATFDGKETVWCPLGDFFCAADELHRFQTWAREATDAETMRSRSSFDDGTGPK